MNLFERSRMFFVYNINPKQVFCQTEEEKKQQRIDSFRRRGVSRYKNKFKETGNEKEQEIQTHSKRKRNERK